MMTFAWEEQKMGAFFLGCTFGALEKKLRNDISFSELYMVCCIAGGGRIYRLKICMIKKVWKFEKRRLFSIKYIYYFMRKEKIFCVRKKKLYRALLH